MGARHSLPSFPHWPTWVGRFLRPAFAPRMPQPLLSPASSSPACRKRSTLNSPREQRPRGFPSTHWCWPSLQKAWGGANVMRKFHVKPVAQLLELLAPRAAFAKGIKSRSRQPHGARLRCGCFGFLLIERKGAPYHARRLSSRVLDGITTAFAHHGLRQQRPPHTATCLKKARGSAENRAKFSGDTITRNAWGTCATNASRPLADFLRPDFTSMAYRASRSW